MDFMTAFLSRPYRPSSHVHDSTHVPASSHVHDSTHVPEGFSSPSQLTTSAHPIARKGARARNAERIKNWKINLAKTQSSLSQTTHLEDETSKKSRFTQAKPLKDSEIIKNWVINLAKTQSSSTHLEDEALKKSRLNQARRLEDEAFITLHNTMSKLQWIYSPIKIDEAWGRYQAVVDRLVIEYQDVKFQQRNCRPK